ncbi:MAG TPA: copper homeostasis membrane protein CopD [Pseudolabrys sp.]|nr:copper homeostasis membrane protein CopD [Pseudolabrys sp.]
MTTLLAIVRSIHFAATVLAAGAVFFRFFIAEPAGAASGGMIDAVRTRCRYLIWSGLFVAVLSGAVWLVLVAANIYGETILYVCTQGGVVTVAGDTRFGQIWCGRLVVALALGALIVPRSSVHSFRTIASVILAAALLASLAWVGHAGATPGVNGTIHLASDVLHLLAAGAWVGGLLPLAMLLAFARRDQRTWDVVMPRVVGRFSVLGMICVGALLITGIINARYLVVTLANLFGTDYGRLVLVKIALFIAMVGVASINKFHLTPRLAKSGATRALRRNSLIELTLGAVVLLVVGFLGTMPPAGHTHVHAAYAPVPENAAFVHIHSEEGMADVTITPGHTGVARATIRLWHEDLTELPTRAVALSLTAPEASIPLTFTARQVADGSWKVDGIRLREGGNWMVKIDARLAPDSHLELDAPIVIER